MNKSVIILAFLVLSLSGFGQDYALGGHVKDEENTPLLGATVVILDAVDSTMLAFGITDESGKFLVYDVPKGNMILQISYTGYSDYGKAIDIAGDNRKIELGEIILSVSSAVLEEVSIKAEHIPMGILGDTINYNAAAFKTRPGASVEDLLKKMPGIEVARDGSIKAQGKDVQNVLVDGKEFFSGDPTIATKNLEAEAIDKVQVYDKKSDEAEFTGIDDGQEQKTINLKLKDGFKNGGFGKAAIDVGTESARQAKLNYNRFSPSVQASIIGNANNINNQAFSFNEYVDFMGGFQNVMATGGLSGVGMNAGSPSNQEGIKDQKSLGSNLNVDFSKALKLNVNYLFAQNKQDLDQTGTTQNFTDNESFSTIDTSTAINKTTNNRINTKLIFDPNPHNSFTLDTRFFRISTNDLSKANTEYLVNGLNQNQSSSNTTSSSTSFNINSMLMYKRKFTKKERNWISSLKYDQTNRDEETDIDNAFRSMTEEDFINQFQSFNNKSETIFGSSKFTEPIGNQVYLGIDYSMNKVVQTPVRDYFNRVDGQLVLDDEISSRFESQWSYHDLGISIKKNRKKLNLNAGINFMHTRLIASDNEIQLNTNENFQYLLPSMSARWKLKGTKSLEFGYDTRLNAPQLSQMITQVNNLNPNYLILGNPNLTPEYVHTLRLNYSSFDQFNFSNQFGNVSFSYSPNKIVNSRNYRADLVTEIIPVNAGNHLMANAYFNHSSPIRKLKIKYNLTATIAYSKYNTFVNGVVNNVSNGNANLDFGVENRNKDIVDIKGGLRLDLSAFSNEFNTNFDEPFVNYSWYLDGFVDMGKGLNIGVEYDYRTYNGAFFQDKLVSNILNASLSKSFLADKLTLKITANDLLNQNIGIGRSGNINTLSDSRYNTLGRFIMFGVSYRIGMVRDNGIHFEA